MATNNLTSRKEEVKFSIHNYEFIRFYNRQRNLNSIISGLKQISYYEDKELKEERITPKNFYYAIRTLSSFVADNIQYLKDVSLRNYFMDKVEELEWKFISDNKYDELKVRFNPKDSTSTGFRLMYFNYVVETFKLASDFCSSLQSTMMISSRSIQKLLAFNQAKPFFENLANYREEIVNDISLFTYGNLIDHILRILGYYYTYKLLMVDDDNIGGSIVETLILLINNEEVLTKIIKSNKYGSKLERQDQLEIHKEGLKIRRLIMSLYYMVNKSLSLRNILPKIREPLLIDHTGI